jgi:hypothetical protein
LPWILLKSKPAAGTQSFPNPRKNCREQKSSNLAILSQSKSTSAWSLPRCCLWINPKP